MWNSKLRFFTVTLTIIILCNSVQSFASDNPEHHEEHYHLSFFAGYSADLKGKGGYKLGIEYEYRVNDPIGFAGTFDFTGADFQIFSFSVGATFYPFKFPLILGAAIGAKHSNNDWDPFFRGIATYDFHIGDFSLGPMLMYDIYSGEKNIISLGVTFGISL